MAMEDSQVHPVISRLLDYLQEDRVQCRVERFYDEVPMDAKYSEDDEDEQSLEAYVAFQRYEKIFEEIIEAFLEKEKMDPQEFYDLCQQCKRVKTGAAEAAMDVDDGKRDDRLNVGQQQATAAALEMVLASLDYSAFCRLMRRKVKQQIQAEDDAADMGL